MPIATLHWAYSASSCMAGLLDVLAARARSQGMTSILLEVRPSNERALDVYRRHGYVHIGRRKGYYPAGAAGREDAIVMRLDL